MGHHFYPLTQEIDDNVTGRDAVCLPASIWFLNHSESSEDMFLCYIKYTEEKGQTHTFVISLCVLPLQKKNHEVISPNSFDL